MIYDLGLSWRSLRNRPIETLTPILVVGLTIALSVAVILLADGATEGIVQASDPFGVLVIGAPGSGQQLVLSSILLQDNPVGNIPYAIYEQLEQDDRAQLVVPLAFGDNIGGARIVGTNPAFFELRTSQSAPPAFQIAEGRLFDYHEADHDEEAHDEDDAVGEAEHEEHDHDHEGSFEAVLGSDAARRLGLKVGETFRATHGVGPGIASDVHEHIYTIVGILQPSGTPYDAAVLTELQSIWEAHEHEAGESENPLIVEASPAAAADQVTAIFVLPAGFIEQNALMQEFYVNPAAQAVAPGNELVGIINLLNLGQQILNAVGYIVLVIAALTVFLSIYSATVSRQQDIAIIRSMGGTRANVFRMVIFEALLITIGGALLGRIIGYSVALGIAAIFSQQSAIPVPIRFLLNLEILLWPLSIGIGIVAGLIPAILAYRVDIVEKLFPT